MPRFLLAFFFLLVNDIAFGQNKKLDSLNAIIRSSQRDSNYYNALAAIANAYKGSNPDSAIFFATKALEAPDERKFIRAKSNAFNALGYANYSKGNFQPSLEAYHNYYTYASRIEDKTGMAYAINNQGNVYIELGDYATALEKYKQALALRQSVNDAKGIASSYNNIGFIYKDLGDYDKAVSNMLFGLRELEKVGDKSLIASTCNLLGAVYTRKKDYKEAINYQERALALHHETENNGGVGITLQVLANIYGEQGLYEKSLEANQQALALYELSGDQRQIATVEGNIGELYARQKRYEQSIPHYKKSIELSEKIGYRRSLANTWMGQAQNYIQLDKLDSARALLDSAAILIVQTKNKEYQRTLYELEARYNAAKGNYKDALDFAFKYSAQKDTLLNEANVKSMSDMSVKYETEKKEAKIALLAKESSIQELQLKNQQLQLDEQLFHLAQDKLELSQADLKIANGELQIKTQNEIILSQKLEAVQRARHLDSLQRVGDVQALEIANRKLEIRRRNTVIYSLGLLLVLGGMLGYSYYRRAQLKAAARMHTAILRQQEEATKAVLEAEEAERSRIAKDLHDGVGQMMSAAKMNLSAYEHEAVFKNQEARLAFEKIINLVDESCSEVRAVSHNMMPNALLKNSLAAAIREFINQLDQRKIKVHLYTEGLEQRLDANTETVLYRVIQECVNNVIKHSGANTLDISLINEANEITATIEDNGQGFDTKADHEGIGLKNIRTRVEYLKGTVAFESAKGQGTLVALHIPLTHNA